MNYKEQIDEYFQRFKPTERAEQMHRVIVHEMGEMYRDLIQRGYTKAETEEQISNVIRNLRGRYPVLNSLPRRNVRGGDLTRTTQWVIVGMYVVVSVGLYLYAPIFAFVPQFGIAWLLMRWTTAEFAKNPRVARRRFTLLWLALLIGQTLGMSLRYPGDSELMTGVLASYGILYLLFGFAYMMFRNLGREFPDQGVLLTILNGPRLSKQVDVSYYFLFVMISGLMYGMHYFFIGIDQLFSTW